MKYIKRRIYFEKDTGRIILDTGKMQGDVIETTVEQDIEAYSILAKQPEGTFDVLELDYGAYDEEFSKCTGYRINAEKRVLEFTYDKGIVQAEGLANLKAIKIASLKRLCELAIEEGFTSKINGHHYRTNRDDQINFIGQKDELTSDPSIIDVPWKTEDAGYVVHTREEWLKIHSEGLAHKKAQLFKYDQLKQAVTLISDTSSVGFAKVDAINW
jgi:hypothetical protein